MKHILKKINLAFLSALKIGASPQRIAVSFAVGIFIAFSPLIFFHWLMVIALSFLFKLDVAIVLLASLFNNPFTAIPFYSFDYFIGRFVVNFFNYNSNWVISLEKIFGSGKICILSFLIGGHIVGMLCAVVSYFLVKFIVNTFILTKISSK